MFLYAQYTLQSCESQNCDKNSVISRYCCLLAKTWQLSQNNFLSAVTTYIICIMLYERSKCLPLARCQMVTQLLYCTRWSCRHPIKTCPEVTLCCESPFDVLAIGDVSVAVSSLQGAYRLVLHWSRYKGERSASASHSRPVWRLLYFSTGQRSCPQGAWDRETPDFIAPAMWPANSPDLNPVDYQTWGKHRNRMHDVDQLKPRLIEEWEHFHQVFIDEAIRQWRPRLRAWFRAHGGHFEHRLFMFDICTDVHFDSHMSLYDCL